MIFKVILLSIFFGMGSVRGQVAEVSSWALLSQVARLGSPAAARLVSRALDGKIPRSQALEILQEAGQLRERGLAVEPFLLKANEGLAKGKSASQIHQALGQTKARLIQEREATLQQKGGPMQVEGEAKGAGKKPLKPVKPFKEKKEKPKRHPSPLEKHPQKENKGHAGHGHKGGKVK